MNKGIVAGQVLNTNGVPASGAIVALTRIYGEGEIFFSDEKGGRKPVYTTANENGRFRINFAWLGSDVGTVGTAPFLYLTAWTEINSKSGRVSTSQVASKVATQTKGFLIKDMLSMQQSALSTFKARGDLEDFAEELVKFSMALLSTESLVLVGGLYLQLR